MTVLIDFKFPDWVTEIKSREAELNLFQAALIQTNRGMLFDSEGDRNGHQKWASLKFRNGQILSNRGALRKSISPFNARGTPGPSGIVRFSEDTILVGTALLYARMMNDGTVGLPGGVLRPKNARALRIPLPKGANATQLAKDLRAQSGSDGKLQQRISRAQERVSKAASAVAEQPTYAAVSKLRRAQDSLAKARATAAKRMKKRQQIRKTGLGGRNFIFVNSVRIPARRFDQWTKADQDELDAALNQKLMEILNG